VTPTPRLWWCPTGPLTILPLHTAGRHRDHRSGQNVLDRVVSSYTPAPRELLESRQSDDEQDRAGRDRDRLLFIDVPDLPDLVPLALSQHHHQVAQVPDQGPVQQLAPAAANPPLHDRIRGA